MTRINRILAAAVVMVGIVATGLVFAQSGAERADCPGKIICPRTGELVCRDKCPTVDPNRSDCPGRIVCPQTGRLVCRDRCPLIKSGTTAETPDSKFPSCYVAKKG